MAARYDPLAVDPDRVLQAVSVFGARVRGHGSDHETPELHAWLVEQQAADQHVAAEATTGWQGQARAIDQRLPEPARRVARGVVRRLRERRASA